MDRRTLLRFLAGAAAFSCLPSRTLEGANQPLTSGPSTKSARSSDKQGLYFAKKAQVPIAIPHFDELRSQLPSPIDDKHPLWIKTYWKAWQLAFRNFHEPSPDSGFASWYIAYPHWHTICLWDSCFMSMFCNYAYPLVPGISNLDNFYAKQHEDGEICREIARDTGVDFWRNTEDKPLYSRWGWPSYNESRTHEPERDQNTSVIYKDRKIPTPNPVLTLDGLDHPIPAWAELEHYQIIGDKSRLEEVWKPLCHYYDALHKYLRQGNGLYVTDWASMDNSPRNVYLKGGGTAIDTSSEMVLFARQLSQIAQILGKHNEAEVYSTDADKLARQINGLMWDEKRNFYFDLQLNGKRTPVMTIAAFWTLLAKVASRRQAAYLVAELENPDTFGRLNLVPSLAANQPGYSRVGRYWRGSVWVPTNTMIIRGLENYGYHDLARKIALNYLNLVANVFEKTGTIWENYAPDAVQHGQPAQPDFVGWSGLGPIHYMLEYNLGLKPDAPHNELGWHLEADGHMGCKRFRFNNHIVTLQANPSSSGRIQINVHSDGSFLLRLLYHGSEKTLSIRAGEQRFEFSPGSSELKGN